MKIVLATPLYPPDTEPIARYNKELASRLATQKDTSVFVVTYGKFPEQTPGVSIISISKRSPTVVRLSLYALKLLIALRDADIMYVQNGASVELPVLLVNIFTSTPFVILDTDNNATSQTNKNKLTVLVSKTLHKRARGIIIETPAEKPEVLPFSSYPTKELVSYEKSWYTHIRTLINFT